RVVVHKAKVAALCRLFCFKVKLG
ncbi:hypothetical protein pipiens_000111, partial [Culex pipiens pipiens]